VEGNFYLWASSWQQKRGTKEGKGTDINHVLIGPREGKNSKKFLGVVIRKEIWSLATGKRRKIIHFV